jgi:hypothetical protein
MRGSIAGMGPLSWLRDKSRYSSFRSPSSDAGIQGLTLVHFSAQRNHILWDMLAARYFPSLLDRGTRGGLTKTA